MNPSPQLCPNCQSDVTTAITGGATACPACGCALGPNDESVPPLLPPHLREAYPTATPAPTLPKRWGLWFGFWLFFLVPPVALLSAVMQETNQIFSPPVLLLLAGSAVAAGTTFAKLVTKTTTEFALCAVLFSLGVLVVNAGMTLFVGCGYLFTHL